MVRKNILSPSFRAQLERVVDDLAARAVDLSVRHIIIVPDRVTLTAEVLLCERLGGAFDVSVMTFNRMFTKYASGKQTYLSAQGSVMIMKKLLARNEGKLTCFTKSIKKKGFAAAVYETVSMLIGCGISPDEIGGLNGKGNDLRVIYEKYLEETDGKMVDAGGRLALLKQFLARDPFIKNSHVYVCCFDNLTKQMRNIIDVIEARALSLSFYSLAPGKYSLGDVTLYSSPSRVCAGKAIVSRIAAEIKRGACCDDFCIVSSDGKCDEIKRILSENGLPYTSSVAVSLASHPLGRLLTAAINASTKGFRPSDVIKLAKNGLVDVTKPDADCFERYVQKYKISYELFSRPFTFCDESAEYVDESGGRRNPSKDMMRAAERVRLKLVGFFLTARTDGIFTLMEKVIENAEPIYNVRSEIKEADKLRAMPFDKARALLELTGSLLSGVDRATQGEAFIAGMESTELTSAPKKKNCIEIGDEGAFRGRRLKNVFIIDFEGDNYPHTVSATSLISDDDITSLELKGIIVSPKVSDVNKRRCHEFMQLISGADNLFLGYSGGVGTYWSTLESECEIKSVTRRSYDVEYAELITAANATPIIKFCQTMPLLTELYRVSVSLTADGFDSPPAMPYLAAACGGDVKKFEMPAKSPRVGSLSDICLSEYTSVSQLETYYACPQRHFFQYAIKGKPLEKGEVLPVDIGNILHRVAEKYINSGADEATAVADRLTDESIGEFEEQAHRECSEGFRLTMRKEARLLVGEICRHLKAGTYASAAAEQEFGGDGGVTLEAGGKRIKLRGKIDRIDRSGDFVRVVDYKTGAKKFSLDDIYAGTSLQLMIYLGVLIGGGSEPGGAYYFNIKADFDTEQLTLSGITNGSPQSLAAADAEIETTGASSVVDVRTSRGKLKGAASADDIRKLAAYAFASAAKAADEIIGGYKAPSPKDGTVCNWCDYRDCCGYDGQGRKVPKAVL